ncbi:MAG: hypothetical protein IJ017_00250 [Oscillospiraceae bacterium]|nr:hypothetical protein [Oscillospiraceae bacterium]
MLLGIAVAVAAVTACAFWRVIHLSAKTKASTSHSSDLVPLTTVSIFNTSSASVIDNTVYTDISGNNTIIGTYSFDHFNSEGAAVFTVRCRGTIVGTITECELVCTAVITCTHSSIKATHSFNISSGTIRDHVHHETVAEYKGNSIAASAAFICLTVSDNSV